MDAIKKSSFTLLELAISMTLGGILILALTSQFWAMARFKTALESKAEPSLEAYLVLNHITHVLRFSKPTGTFSFDTTSSPSFDLLTVNIEGGCIPLIPKPSSGPNNVVCYYKRYKGSTNANALYFQVDTNPEQLLSRYVTYFDASRTGDEITLKLIFAKGGTVTPIRTKIKALGQ
jgi:Tfp pilus assembly protein PilW